MRIEHYTQAIATSSAARDQHIPERIDLHLVSMALELPLNDLPDLPFLPRDANRPA
jgi:hypothetical protein